MSADIIAGSDMPPRGSGLTDELPVITVEFERQPWDAAAAAAWIEWQSAPGIGGHDIIEPKPERRGLLDRVSSWFCDRLPETILTAAALICAWADGLEQAPRQPEPYRETYRPAHYVGRAAPVAPRRSVSAVWLITELWSEQGGRKYSGAEWMTAWNDGIPAEYEGSHRRETARGTVAQRERSRVEQQWNASTDALEQIDQRERMRMILVDPLALSRAALMMVPPSGTTNVIRHHGPWIKIASVA